MQELRQTVMKTLEMIPTVFAGDLPADVQSELNEYWSDLRMLPRVLTLSWAREDYLPRCKGWLAQTFGEGVCKHTRFLIERVRVPEHGAVEVFRPSRA